MKAAVVAAFDRPVELEDRPVPEPGDGQVLVRVEASGLCHTDIHAARGDWPVKPTVPFVPGHEEVGIVTQVGAGVTHVAIGDRVAVHWLGYACGRCGYCVSGRETLCESQLNTGYAIDGAHAEYALAYADHVVPVPDAVSSLDAAPLTCAGVTTYKAVKVSGLRPTERAAIFGIGGLGHLALQYARIFGAETIAVDVTDAKLRLAAKLGADHQVNAATRYLRDDDDIHAEVEAKVLAMLPGRDPELRVSVRGGEVLLLGRVEWRSALAGIEELVAPIPGVVKVANRIGFRWNDGAGRVERSAR